MNASTRSSPTDACIASFIHPQVLPRPLDSIRKQEIILQLKSEADLQFCIEWWMMSSKLTKTETICERQRVW